VPNRGTIWAHSWRA